MNTESTLEKLKKNLSPYFPLMSKASDEIINQEISKYPIFVSSDQEINLGIPLTVKNNDGVLISLNISSLEEFATKNVIQEDKVDKFIEIFKDPEDYFCLFLIDQLGSNFVFIPR